MIRYNISLDDLRSRIEIEKPGWLERAKDRTDDFRSKQKYQEKSSIWSDVKPVYMRLQGEKCAYCERKLEAIEYGKVEQDVEHFRPKGNIRAWRASRALRDAGVTLTAVPQAGKGYYLLPYHPFNYAAACKPCNSILKKDYFPIAAAYDLEKEDPTDLLGERPFLIYPIGDFDDDPEEIIRFTGVSPQPCERAGRKCHRALVTIEFFKLDDLKRKNLMLERAQMLIALLPQLEKRSGQGHDAEKAGKLIQAYTASIAPHANCARSFKRLFETAPDKARAIWDKAVDFVISSS